MFTRVPAGSCGLRRESFLPVTGRFYSPFAHSGHSLAPATADDPDRDGHVHAAIAGADHIGISCRLDRDLVHAVTSTASLGAGRFSSAASRSRPFGRNCTSMLWGVTTTFLIRRWTMSYCPTLVTEPEGWLASIVDFTFNLGAGRLQTSTLRRRVNQRDWSGAAIELRRWVYGGGKVLPGLIIRRVSNRICI